MPAGKRSLDLGFLEFNMLARNRIVLTESHLFRNVARVLLRHIVEARVCSRDELDLDGCWLRDGGFLKSYEAVCGPKKHRPRLARPFSGRNWSIHLEKSS